MYRRPGALPLPFNKKNNPPGVPDLFEVAKMKRLKIAVIVLVVAIFWAIPAHYVPGPSAQAAQTKTEKKEVKVWVNTNSNVYHCPGTRWYGKTKHGEYMSECEAIKKGNRAAYGKACGSECK